MLVCRRAGRMGVIVGWLGFVAVRRSPRGIHMDGRRLQRGLPPPPRLIDLLANEVRKALSS